MPFNSLIYVAQVVAPALLVAAAFEAWRRGAGYRRDALAWSLAALCLIPSAVFPEALEWFGDLVGIRMPGPFIAAVGVAALTWAWWVRSGNANEGGTPTDQEGGSGVDRV